MKMAESTNNLSESENQTDDSDDGIIEFSNRELNYDIEYTLIEKNAQHVSLPSLLDQLESKIDNKSENNNNNDNNNYDDYIEEDLFLINGDDLQQAFSSVSTTLKTENNVSTTSNTNLATENETKFEAKSILISDTSIESEPSVKLIKEDEQTTKVTASEDKTTEMVEFLLEKSKLKDKQPIIKRGEQKFSTLISTFQIEDNSTKNSARNKLDLINKPKSKLDPDESAFIWTELEAFIKQHEQTGQSSCGASAIINVLKALNFDIDYEKVNNMVKINSRIPESQASTTTLAQYLFSRSKAGMNAAEMLENIQTVTSNKINGRFFSFKAIQHNHHLSKWLAKWIRKGAVPVALLNLQLVGNVWYNGHCQIPDAWHHQMIYAITSNDVYLTNPLERKPIESMLRELNSESVLLIRIEDVLKRFNANPVNLNEFLIMKDHSSEEKKRWFKLNVLGQVANVLRSTSNINQTHIKIPASYVSGITLFAWNGSNLYEEILLEKL